MTRADDTSLRTQADEAGQVSLSDHLRKLARGHGETIRIDEMVAKIDGADGLGPILLILTLPVMMPLPPGLSMVMAIPILIVAPQVAVERRTLWLPQWLARRAVKRDALDKVIRRVLPTLERAERMVRPRMRFLATGAGSAAVGAACTLIAVILILPLPFANLLPSWSLASFAIGLTRKDGHFVLLGYALLAAAAAVTGAALLGAGLGIAHIKALFPA